MILQTELLRVVDLKQYVYCPRVYYYAAVLPAIRPITYKMEAGIAAHHSAEKREKRRQLRTYRLQNGQRHFNVAIVDQTLGVTGEIDMVIETADEVIPVDYKLSKKEGKHFRLQVMVYGLLLESQQTKPVKRGFLYLIPQRKAVEVRFTPHLRRKAMAAITAMREMVLSQRMPNATTQRGKCVDCEFRRFCNDVL